MPPPLWLMGSVPGSLPTCSPELAHLRSSAATWSWYPCHNCTEEETDGREMTSEKAEARGCSFQVSQFRRPVFAITLLGLWYKYTAYRVLCQL